MPHVEVDHSWECEEVVHDDYEFSGNNNVDESKSLMIKFYMHPDSSYRKEWRYANSEGYNKLLYKIDKAVDVTQHNSVKIDVDMLSSAPMPAALRISEKVLICQKPAACKNNLKVLASDIISKSRQIISSSATAKPNNKCSFLMIAIHVRYNVFIYLDERDMKVLEQHKRVLPPDYSTLLKPLPILKSDANNPFEFCEERCAICWEGYLVGSRMIRMQCLHELEYIGGYDSDIIRLPCSHEFHPNCIATWSKTTNSCPLCRFEMHKESVSYLELSDSLNSLDKELDKLTNRVEKLNLCGLVLTRKTIDINKRHFRTNNKQRNKRRSLLSFNLIAILAHLDFPTLY